MKNLDNHACVQEEDVDVLPDEVTSGFEMSEASSRLYCVYRDVCVEPRVEFDAYESPSCVCTGGGRGRLA